jgi:hypothetical protein
MEATMFDSRKGDSVGPTTLPAGTYYIGDPCYVIPDDDWMDYLDSWPVHPNPHIGWKDGAARYKGKTCWHAGTAYGDGTYEDQYEHTYGVDAGLIGIVPIDLCKGTTRQLQRLGQVVIFNKSIQVYRDEDYTFRFGHIRIPTSDPNWME